MNNKLSHSRPNKIQKLFLLAGIVACILGLYFFYGLRTIRSSLNNGKKYENKFPFHSNVLRHGEYFNASIEKKRFVNYDRKMTIFSDAVTAGNIIRTNYIFTKFE